MTRSIRLLPTLLILTLPLVSFAQDEPMEPAPPPEHPEFLMFNQNMIPAEHVDRYSQNVDSLLKPVLDAMVDEGLISTWGMLEHAWGDEWNWAWFIYTKDHATFVSAWSEMVERVNDLGPDAWDLLIDPIEKHKDNLLEVRHLKTRPLAEGEAPAGLVMLNQHVVALRDLEAANEQVDQTTAVVLDAMVDEGIIHYWGQANHLWGDKWNLNFYFSSENLEDFASDWAEFVRRMDAQHPDALEQWNRLTKAHKDNLYNIRHRR